MKAPNCSTTVNDTDGTALVTVRTRSRRTFLSVTMTVDGETYLEIVRDEVTLHKMLLSVSEPREKP